ncbi:hypothetical protein SORBI_3006G012000 [Sorghum bicolor]|uniref:Uncharacterized protein n=1 Tax=Sorghum bicolor TaxID=4558 RepID=A0A1Z5RCF2_SORBI|nr:hypothetical protein SORBI_3006G012000 [Sorghum bicolor]
MAAAGGAGTTTEEEGLPILSGKEPTTTTTKPTELTAADACISLVVVVLLILGVIYLSTGVVHLFSHWQRLFGPYDPVEYTVTIAAVSGLDLDHPAAKVDDLHPAGLLLYPAFNLTLHVASPRTAEDRECVEPGTTVEVSYLRSGLPPLATGTAPAFCVDVGERREETSIVAWGDGVRLPRLVLDSLAADLLRGAAEFGVRLTPLPDCGGRGQRFCSDTVDVISCWAKVGGGPAPCKISKERVLFRPVPRPGSRDSPAANLPQPTP